MNIPYPIKSTRYGLLVLLTSIILGVSFITRAALFIKSLPKAELTFFQILGAFSIGIFFDLVEAFYFIIPSLLYIWLLPEKLFQTRVNQYILYGIFFLQIFLLLFNSMGEWFFWDEFTTRFNFIAVDYLIYTTEVIGNIRQSYPIEWTTAALIVLAAVITIIIKARIDQCFLHPVRFKVTSFWAIGLLTLPVLTFVLIDNSFHNFSRNSTANELAGNGLYELFAAYRNNELNYDQFYPHLPEKEIQDNLEKMLFFNDPSENLSVTRKVVKSGGEKKLNVVLISIESFSAEFMGIFGNKGGNTPFLDSLSQHSLVFTNLYATGTRTVRGLEALSLAVPPTPGIRRD